MHHLAFVGGPNRTDTRIDDSHGLHSLAFDPATGRFSLLQAEAGADNPSYLAVDATTDTLYAVNEVGSWLECTVSAYRLDRQSGALSYLGKQPTRGRTSCHVALLPHRRLGVANYSHEGGGPDQAVCFYPLESDGHIGAPEASAPHSALAGGSRDRSHAHCLAVTSDERLILAADLGLDCIIGYDAGDLTEKLRLPLPAGHGPRHIALHPGGTFIYVLNELRPLISILAWDGSRLQHLGDVETLLAPPAPDAVVAGAAIQLSPDGRHLYASTRGPDCISVFSVAGPQLSLVEVVSCGGTWPRDFSLTPTAEHLVVANQQSNALAVFARDEQSGRLSDTGERFSVLAPQCVKFLAP